MHRALPLLQDLLSYSGDRDSVPLGRTRLVVYPSPHTRTGEPGKDWDTTAPGRSREFHSAGCLSRRDVWSGLSGLPEGRLPPPLSAVHRREVSDGTAPTRPSPRGRCSGEYIRSSVAHRTEVHGHPPSRPHSWPRVHSESQSEARGGGERYTVAVGLGRSGQWVNE